MALLLCFLPGALSAATRTWDGGGANELASNRTNWSNDTAPVENDDIVLSTTSHKSMTWNMTNMTVASWTQDGYLGTVTVATVYNPAGFTNLNITGNCTINHGVWTHTGNSSAESYRLSVTIGGNLVVGSSGKIDVLGKGYAAGSGPGVPLGGGAGSYGGVGGYDNPFGKCYGSIIAPTNLGSGGSGNQPGSGGGAIFLTVAGNAIVNGAIRAESVNGINRTGSGGSIFITAGSLSGSGTISANGGAGHYGAGGGRIALVVTNASADFTGFTGAISALGGASIPNTKGCAGTIYLQKQSDLPGRGELIIDNNNGNTNNYLFQTALSGSEPVTSEFRRITLANNAILQIGRGETLIMTNTELVVSGTKSGIWLDGGTLRVPSSFAWSNMFIGISATGSTFNASAMTVGTNAEFRLDKPHEMIGNLIITPGSKLTHTQNSGGTESYKIVLSINGSLTVHPAAGIDVTGRGYVNGPGYPPGGAGGGSYGGSGWPETLPIGRCYGSIVAPTNLGSGGAGNGPGNGGGAIILRVTGGLTNNGLIKANGGPANNRPGSGGSINIESGLLAGNGVICANGGSSYGGGGGGRVALAVTNSGADIEAFDGIISAFGAPGTAAGRGGAAGTVYVRNAGQDENHGTLLVDNNDLAVNASAITYINSNMTDTAVGTVVIRNMGRMVLDTNQTLTVSGDWYNSSSFTGMIDSAVIFAGPPGSVSSIHGYTTFMGLICTNGIDKTLQFQAGTITEIAPGGRLLLSGAPSSTNLLLRSSVDGNAWRLDLDPLAAQSVSCVDVKDSDALTGIGAEIIGVNSKDRGGNVNWRFLAIHPGQTITWTGGSNTFFPLRYNWDLDRTPIETDVIVIPGGCGRYPVLNADYTLYTLDIRSGGELFLDGRNVVVSNLLVAGRLIASGTETITLLKDADFTGGVFDSVQTTLTLAGGNAQSLKLGNATFYRIRADNSVAPMTFSGGFTATELNCIAPDGTRNLVFEPGKVVNLRDILLLGSAGSPNIILRSSTPGQSWRLEVSGYRSVRGVDVRDSDAALGLPITATLSTDSGNNVNWLFGAEWSEWLGAINTDFHTADNWSSGIVPDANTRVRMDSPNPMVLSWPVTVLDLTVGGGAAMAAATINAEMTVIEDIVVLTNGTLALNRPCLVRNNVYLLPGGLLTHSGPQASEANKLEMNIHGGLTVDPGAFLDVSGKGWFAGQGPGGGSGGGASHGGIGTLDSGTSFGPCYGSIIAPTNLGSGGRAGQITAGGGAILLRVAGELRVDGNMLAEGQYIAGYNRPGSGGSINIIAGALKGLGLISARGVSLYAGSGGGRIALAVTNAGANFSVFGGQITACGGLGYSLGAGGSGTIYLKRASDHPGRGTVFLNNNNYTGIRFSYVPPAPPGNVIGEADRAPFRISNGATLRLTNDYMVGDIWLDTANATLDLGGKTLTVRSREHPLGPGQVLNPGAIIWWPDIPRGTIYNGK